MNRRGFLGAVGSVLGAVPLVGGLFRRNDPDDYYVWATNDPSCPSCGKGLLYVVMDAFEHLEDDKLGWALAQCPKCHAKIVLPPERLVRKLPPVKPDPRAYHWDEITT